MENNKDKPFFLVNIDKKQFVDLKKTGLESSELLPSLLQKWHEDRIKPLNELDIESCMFTDVTDKIIEQNRETGPFITVESDEKTETITIHRHRPKKTKSNE